jgi:hypothetical protein
MPGQLKLVSRRSAMRNTFKFAVVTGVMVIGTISQALAQSYSFPTYAYLHRQIVSQNDGAPFDRKTFYDFVPGPGDQATSAAARGNSR